MPAQEHGRAVLLRGFNVFTVKSARRNGRVADVVEQKVQMQSNPQNERPVRGDNRTGQAIWALGVDGRSRRIQPMGRVFPLPHVMCRRGRAARSKSSTNFLTFLKRVFAAKIYSAAGRVAPTTPPGLRLE